MKDIAANDPARIDRVMAELKAGKKPTTDLDIALATYRVNETRLAYRAAALELRNAQVEGGDAIRLTAARNAEAEAKSKLDDITRLTREVGTQSGRALNAFRLMVSEDYSLENMTTRAEAAAGRELTEAEKSRLADVSQRLTIAETGVGSAQEAMTAAKKGYGTAEYDNWQKNLAEAAGIRREADTIETKLARENRSPAEKLADLVVWWRRIGVISSPKTMVKIMAASAAKMAIAPVESAAGEALRRIPGLSKIARAATSEGQGFSASREIKSAMSGFTEGMVDAWKRTTTGTTDLDLIYGSDKRVNPVYQDLIYRLHGAAKDPAVRNAYTRSFLSQLDAAAAKGLDVTNPARMLQIGARAYVESNRAKFAEDNRLGQAGSDQSGGSGVRVCVRPGKRIGEGGKGAGGWDQRPQAGRGGFDHAATQARLVGRRVARCRLCLVQVGGRVLQHRRQEAAGRRGLRRSQTR